jgi:type II secretory pathway pseudopilin PulG
MRKTAVSRRTRAEGAFSLVELLVALAVALTMAAGVIQGVAGASRSGERLVWLLRERQVARRTLALLRSELEFSESWQVGPGAGVGAECPLGGRTPVLQLVLRGRRMTYSVGPPPSQIWRGSVLMRCGPAYGLSGELSGGAAQNRVLIDGLVPEGLQVAGDAPGVLHLRLDQGFRPRGGSPLTLRTTSLVGLPTF